MENGYILLHRKIKNKGYYRKSQYVHLWIHLLLSANHKENEFLWNGKMIKIKAGQFITGREELSKQTGIPQTTIERILDLLEKEGQIGQQKSNKNRIITIVNWNKYQINKSKADNRRTTDGQQTDTNNKEEKANNEKKDVPIPFFKSSSLNWKRELRKWRDSGGRTVEDYILTEKDGEQLLMKKDDNGKKIWITYKKYKLKHQKNGLQNNQ
jgi:hypothetical protein